MGLEEIAGAATCGLTRFWGSGGACDASPRSPGRGRSLPPLQDFATEDDQEQAAVRDLALRDFSAFPGRREPADDWGRLLVYANAEGSGGQGAARVVTPLVATRLGDAEATTQDAEASVQTVAATERFVPQPPTDASGPQRLPPAVEEPPGFWSRLFAPPGMTWGEVPGFLNRLPILGSAAGAVFGIGKAMIGIPRWGLSGFRHYWFGVPVLRLKSAVALNWSVSEAVAHVWDNPDEAVFSVVSAPVVTVVAAHGAFLAWDREVKAACSEARPFDCSAMRFTGAALAAGGGLGVARAVGPLSAALARSATPRLFVESINTLERIIPVRLLSPWGTQGPKNLYADLEGEAGPSGGLSFKLVPGIDQTLERGPERPGALVSEGVLHTHVSPSAAAQFPVLANALRQFPNAVIAGRPGPNSFVLHGPTTVVEGQRKVFERFEVSEDGVIRRTVIDHERGTVVPGTARTMSRNFALYPAVVRTPAMPRRLYSVSDLHGEIGKAAALFHDHGLVAGRSTTRPRWTGGDATLVVAGDSINKGSSLETLRYLRALQESAEASGGRVIVQWGNHEAYLLSHPNWGNPPIALMRDEVRALGVAPEEFVAGRPLPWPEDDGLIDWIRNQPVAVHLGDADDNGVFFFHAGATNGRLRSGIDADTQQSVAAGHQGPLLVGRRDDPRSMLTSIVWDDTDRRSREGPNAIFPEGYVGRALQEALDATRNLRVRTILFGHNPRSLGRDTGPGTIGAMYREGDDWQNGDTPLLVNLDVDWRQSNGGMVRIDTNDGASTYSVLLPGGQEEPLRPTFDPRGPSN